MRTGGKELPLIFDYHLLEELCLAGPPQTGKGVGIIGQTLMRHGNEFQKSFFLPRILNAEIEWVIGYSEPEAGSDLAALKLRASRDGPRSSTGRPGVSHRHHHRAARRLAAPTADELIAGQKH